MPRARRKCAGYGMLTHRPHHTTCVQSTHVTTRLYLLTRRYQDRLAPRQVQSIIANVPRLAPRNMYERAEFEELMQRLVGMAR